MPITIGALTFKTQKECEAHTRALMCELGATESVRAVNEAHFNYFNLLCQRHPDSLNKLKKAVDFKILPDALNKRAWALFIVNGDATNTEISWRICVTGKGKSPHSMFNAALRQCISGQIQTFRNGADLSRCTACKLRCGITHIDHHEPQFAQLVSDFTQINAIVLPTDYAKKEVTFEVRFLSKDQWIGDQFSEYHLRHATFRVLCPTCNLTRAKYKKV